MALLIGLFCFSTALLFTSPAPPAADDRGYFLPTESLARFGTLYTKADDVEFPLQYMVEGRDGTIYPIYGLGQSLIQLPLYWASLQVGERLHDDDLRYLVEVLGLRATPALLFGITVALLFYLLRSYFGFSSRISFVVCCLYAFGTMAFPYSKSNYSEPLQATLLIALLCFALVWHPRRSLPLLTLAVGLLVLTKATLAIVLPPVALFVLWQWRQRGCSRVSVVTSAVILLAAAFLFGYWNTLRGGSILDIYGPSTRGFLSDALFAQNPLRQAFHNLLVSPRKNLLLFNPVLVLVLPGLFWLRPRGYKVMWAAMLVPYLLAMGMAVRTPMWGGTAWGPRYLMPMLVVSMPFVGASLERIVRWPRLPRALACVAVCVLFAASAYVSFLGSSFTWFRAKQVCHLYSEATADFGLRACDGDFWATNDVALHHYLFWNASPAQVSRGDIAEFPWLHAWYSPSIASVLLGEEQAGLLLTDYLFFNLDAFATDTTALLWLRSALVLTSLLSLTAILATMTAGARRVVIQEPIAARQPCEQSTQQATRTVRARSPRSADRPRPSRGTTDR